MPDGLYRFYYSGSAHFITFTCYHRRPHLEDGAFRDLFVKALERTRLLYDMKVYGFVVMPEHIHLLISEPHKGTVATAMRSLKISSAKRGRRANAPPEATRPFWQKRYYDRNVWGKELIEKLKYIHRDPVRRDLAAKPEDWKWSSFRHYASGDDCGVAVESWRSRTYTLDPIIAN